MPTNERNFIRVGPRASSGFGNLRFISFNTWLIIINVAVFLINALLNVNVHTSMGQVFVRGVSSEEVKRAVVFDIVKPDPKNPGWFYKPIVDPASVDPTTGQPLPREIGRDRFAIMPLVESLGHFSTAKAFVPGFQVWRFITFQFLHYNWIHLLFNMLGLWFVGGMVEQHLGFKRYAAFYLTCGIFGALFYLLLNFLGFILSAVSHDPVNVPGLLFNDVYTPLIGASAGVFGVLIAAARLEPMATVWVYFLIPVRLRTAVIILVLITLFNLFSGSQNAGGEAAHVGGIIAGFYFIKRIYLLRDFFDIFGNSRLPRRNGARRSGTHPQAPITPSVSPIEREVERILLKSEQHGIHSLTDEERQLLREYNQAAQRG